MYKWLFKGMEGILADGPYTKGAFNTFNSTKLHGCVLLEGVGVAERGHSIQEAKLKMPRKVRL